MTSIATLKMISMCKVDEENNTKNKFFNMLMNLFFLFLTQNGFAIIEEHK